MKPVIYGIKHCNSIKKALAWLDEHGIAYDFHDYKKAGIAHAKVLAWSQAVGWRTLLNTRGTTWRKLSPQEQAIETEDAAVQKMVEQPSLIKRPVVETADGQLLVGFDPHAFARTFKPEECAR